MCKDLFKKDKLKNFYLNIRSFCIRLFVKREDIQADSLDKVRSILVVRLDRVGDVVMSLPSIKALKMIFPEARICVLVKKDIAPLLEALDYINKVIIYNGFFDFILMARRNKFDMAVDLLADYTIKSAALVFLTKAKARAGFDISRRGDFFNIKVSPDSTLKHMSLHILDLPRAIAKARGLNINFDKIVFPELILREVAITRAKRVSRDNALREGDLLISIHPGGYYPSQRWGLEKFAALGDRLGIKYSARIAVITSFHEKHLAGKIASLMKIKPILITDMALDEVAAFISMSDLLVCNNSGLLHVACALNVPTVSTMGPTVPCLWGPLGPCHIVINKNVPCSPCSLGVCRHHICMDSITIEEMEKACEVFLEGHGGHKGENVSQRDLFSNNKMVSPENINKILIINLGGIGDFALSTPALRAIRKRYEKSKIYFLSTRNVNELAKYYTYIDETLDFNMRFRLSGAFGNIKILSYLKDLGIDLAINMRTLVSPIGALKIKFIMDFIGAKVKVGRNTEGRGSFFDIKVPESRIGDKSELQYDIDMARALGAEIRDEAPELMTDELTGDRVNIMLKALSVGVDDLLIGIHPGGKPSHRWGAEKFADVINIIDSHIKAKFIITGDGLDRDEFLKMKPYLKPQVIDSVGKLNIRELLAVIKRCSLYISDDTSAMHLASILGVNLIAIFGPGYLKRFDPRNVSGKAVVFTATAACAPCDRYFCRKKKCFDGITSAEVAKSALKILRGI